MWSNINSNQTTSFGSHIDYGINCVRKIHFRPKKTGKISIVFQDLSKNSVFFRTEVKPKEKLIERRSLPPTQPERRVPFLSMASDDGTNLLTNSVRPNKLGVGVLLKQWIRKTIRCSSDNQE